MASGGLGGRLSRSASVFSLRIFLSMRITTRAFEAVLAVQVHRSWLVGVAAACVLADLRLSTLTQRPMRGRTLLIRLIVDTMDMTLWAMALHGSADTTAVVAGPLAGDLALRVGLAAIGVPAVAGTVTMVVLWLTHTPSTTLVYLWPTLAVFMGVLGGAYLRVRHEVRERDVEWRIEAAAVRAEAAGRDGVAAGADGVVDVLARLDPLLRAHEPDPPPFPVAVSAADPVGHGTAHAVYLREAVLDWERAHNNAGPDLSGDVDVRLGAGTGTLLLSAPQEGRLVSAIARMDLSGEVVVEAEDPGPVGTAQVVLVNRERVVLPADPLPLSHSIHPVPLAFLWGALTVLCQSLPAWEAVTLAATIPLALLSLGTGWWMHRRLVRRGHVSAGTVLAAGVAVGAAQAVVTSALARPGSGRLPFLFFLLWVGLLLGYYLRDLPPFRQGLVLSGCLAAVVAGIAVLPDHVSLWSMPVALLWPLAGALSVGGLRTALDTDLAELDAGFERRYAEAVGAAARRGRDRVIEITSAALTELSWRFADAPLPPADEAEIGGRLAEATGLLGALIRQADTEV